MPHPPAPLSLEGVLFIPRRGCLSRASSYLLLWFMWPLGLGQKEKGLLCGQDTATFSVRPGRKAKRWGKELCPPCPPPLHVGGEVPTLFGSRNHRRIPGYGESSLFLL